MPAAFRILNIDVWCDENIGWEFAKTLRELFID